LLELDVGITLDNVIVVSHDESLGRVSVSNVKILNTNYADLPAFKTTIDYSDMEGSYTQTSDDDATLLKLEDLFTNMSGTDVLYSIDLHIFTKAAALLVYNLIQTNNLQSRVVWGCGDATIHAYLKELDSGISTYYPESNLIKIYVWQLFGCLMCVPLSDDILMAPIMTDE